MKNRVYSLAIVICLMSVIMLSLFAGCIDLGGGDNNANGNADCKHSWSSWSVIKNPTCTEQGEETRKCSKCNKVEKRSIPIVDHNFVEKSDSTKKWKECSYCGYKTDVVDITMTAQEIYNQAKLSVVEIRTFDKSNNGLATGSGFFVSSTEICTNYHVIENAYIIKIYSDDKQVISDMHIVGYDKEKDIASIRVNGYTNPAYLDTDTQLHSIGETIYTLGSSKGLTGTFSDGIISNNSRNIENVNCYQITAPISPGNSGGPLLSNKCKVLGINSMTLIDGQNINFAIKIEEYNRLSKNKKLTPIQFYNETHPRTPSNIPDIGDNILYEQGDNNHYYQGQMLTNGNTIIGIISNTYDYFDHYKVRLKKGQKVTFMLSVDNSYDLNWMHLALLDSSDGDIVLAGVRLDDTMAFSGTIPYDGVFSVCIFRLAEGYPYPSTSTKYAGYILWQ